MQVLYLAVIVTVICVFIKPMCCKEAYLYCMEITYMFGMVTPVIIVHGGAWAIPDHMAEASVAGVKAAARAGYAVLQQGGSAVQAVEAAITLMEDDPVFDAGTGSVLNSAGDVEMDAVIMEGSQLNAGAVACVQNIKNPIQLARLIMEETDHVLLVGEGANKFAEERGVETVPQSTLVTDDARKSWERFMKFRTTVDVLFRDRTTVACPPIGCDTVGATALDSSGNVAFGTSTGGITAKRPGRVGDSPLIGCGGYCDNEVGGVSTTGHGEAIIKVCLAKHTTDLMREGLSPQKALESALEFMTSRVKGSGGGVAVSKDGQVGLHFTTQRMAWAWLKQNQLHYGLDHQEDCVEKIS
ncbi:isoaspartyl peptidase/L-asparaginase-like isoform X2 [Liolophura sinensis]